MARVFMLEDDGGRVGLVLQRCIGHTVEVVDSCMAADKYRPPYDLVLLDHDLGGRQLEDHEDNGEAFVRLIGERIVQQEPPPVIIVHSFNPDGAARILQAIRDFRGPSSWIYAWRAPFGTPFFWDVIDASIGARFAPPLPLEG